MAKTDRKAEYYRQVAAGEIKMIDGIPVYIGPRHDPAIVEQKKTIIRKQLARMAKSKDPWARKKAAKWAGIARPRKVVPFWRRAMTDVNPHGNVYHGLYRKEKDGWHGVVAEFPLLRAWGKTLTSANVALIKKVKAYCEAVDKQIDANQSAGGVIVGLRPDGRVAIWIGEMSKLK